jgi:hypothetical protein
VLARNAIAALLVGAGLTAGAATFTVDDDGPADFSSIQSAVAGASNGDEIVVQPGRYRETVNFLGKALTVRSAEGPANTVIFLEQETRIILLNGDSTLRGFTITGGRARIGGGIYVTDGALATIEGNIIEDNRAEWNGSLPGFGGGIGVDLAANPVITRNVIRNNVSVGDASGAYGYGGGVDIGDYASATITNNVVANNEATDSGGGLSIGINGDPVQILHNTIVDNSAGSDGDAIATLGGGVLLEDGFSGEVRNNLLRGNRADDGGGIYFLANGDQGIDYTSNNFDGDVPNGCAGLPGSKCTTNQLFFPSALQATLRPRSDSSLIDAGQAAGLPPVDADGFPRNVDGDLDGAAAPDVGAFENQAEATRLRFDGPTALAWDGSVNPAVTWELYRDALAGAGAATLGICEQNGLPGPSATDADTPAAGSGFLYLVRGRDTAVGSLGYSSAATERTPTAPCP